MIDKWCKHGRGGHFLLRILHVSLVSIIENDYLALFNASWVFGHIGDTHKNVHMQSCIE